MRSLSKRRTAISRAVFFILAAGIMALSAATMAGRAVGPAPFVVPPGAVLAAAPPVSGFVDPDGPRIQHAASATELPDGRIAAFWFAGRGEGADDVGIYTATFDGSAWSESRRIIDGRTTADALGRRIRTVANPVVFRHPGGEFWLIYVSVTAGRWSGSSLNLARSADGESWGPPVRLASSPFFNLSTLTKGPPLIRADGIVALPVYHELAGTFGELLFLDAGGFVLGKERLTTRCMIQPWAVALDPDTAVALLRDYGCGGRELRAITGTAGGTEWSAPVDTGFANPDAPSATIRLDADTLLAVTSEETPDGIRLRALRSDDRGATWTGGALLSGPDWPAERYRYPWLLQDRNGRVHLLVSEGFPLYSRIRHTILDPAIWSGDGDAR
jgi:predicted neuraminidase